MAVTPLMQQYYDIKKENPGCILFFRMGDFFELFEDDAVIASKILGLTLTSRNNGAAGATPLCGFPHHAAERYVPKMVAAGYRIAICEQVEDPKLAKGIVKRDIVEIISAGTAMNEANLEAKEANYLCAYIPAISEDGKGGKGDVAAFAIADVTTGYLAACRSSVQSFECEFSRRMPKEIVVPEGTTIPSVIMDLIKAENVLVTELPAILFAEDQAKDVLFNHFKVEALDGLGLEGRAFETSVTGALLQYLINQKKSELSHFTTLEILNLDDYMTLDPSTLRNLELVRPLNADDYSSTLCSVLDFTVTAMGGRTLKDWVSHPLIAVDRIRERQEAVGELVQNPVALDELKESLTSILDMERLMGRVGSGRANARDLAGMGRSLSQASKVADVLEGLHASLFEGLREKLNSAKGRGEDLLKYFNDDLPMTVREGGMIRPGASTELDAMNEDIKERREWIASLEGRERERLGIPTLKVGYNRVFGYYIEITKAQMAKATQPIPDEYIRKQTTVNGERYITPEMKECESVISNAEANIHDLEYRIFCEIRERVNSWRAELQSIADAVARVDSLYSFAFAARKFNYVCPEVFEGTGIEIRGGFHPVIVAVNPDLNFIPNDVTLSPDGTRLMLITGPNMAGKSTYLRQTGLIVLMAQIGCFVPAESARIGVVDRIFTRVGASDRLSRGLSTFMVEMIETANILRNATPHSLVLLDEIGRGTSTFDGLSIAWAIVETLHSEPARMALTLFATHYHELTGLVESLEHAGNFQVGVQEKGDKLIFLHKIFEGACDSSYGIHVAEMAGLPPNVVRRARKILLRLEKQKIDPSDEAQNKKIKAQPQMDLFAPPDENTLLLKDEIRRLKPEEMTPMQALQRLMDLKENYGK
ncbi:DNA mismatch repair protein MutS [Fibrobacter sp.]|uniref:DNA mismatch repair protein MutS n=1 Tax=Fibrobacter sp. TaxID=35828 RepID=UPI0025C5C91E|nr:DNA mismatch repair protein MutS [Fibrobacter sp.]MBR3072966.1 DNA mismatch repair protein MutS [Fibrobacter sp.]